jgi:type VI secretion system secreted protein Hcp
MATDIFLKLDGIDGESKDKKHKGEIQLDSFSFGVTQTGSSGQGGGAGTGKAHFQDVHLQKLVDKATPNLIGACATGKHIATAVVVFRKAGGEQEEYFTIKFKDVIVSSVQGSDAGGSDGVLREQVSLNFSQVQYIYKEQNEKGTLVGTVDFGYDVKANTKS